MKISTIILTFNSEAILGATLASVITISDEIFVVDSFSRDGTAAIAARYGAHCVQHPFQDYSSQRNWAIDHLPITGDWELHLDADERLSDELGQEIAALKLVTSAVDGYLVPRLTFFLGRPIRHGGHYPIWHLRLFRHRKGRCEERLYDQHFYVSGQTARLRHPMIDDQRNCLTEWSTRHLRWAEAEMNEILSGRRESETAVAARLDGSRIEQKRALRGYYYRLPLLLRPFIVFFYKYVIRLGFLDGREGLIFFALQTFWFRFLVDAKIYERRLAAAKAEKTPPLQ